MADPITAEQVARAIDAAYDCNAQGVNAALGAFWYEREDIPADVRDGWRQVGYLGLRIALTRWRDELAAAEPARPEPAEDSPERLRERRDALGLSAEEAAVAARMGGHANITMGDVMWMETPPATNLCASDRARYAAALSAAEAERPDKPDHLAYADSPVWDDGPLPTPTPERPAPRFKVGDWARDRDTVFRVAEMHWDDDRWYARPVAGVRDGIAEYSLQPASPPAPEVVDVPQPIVKRCACPDVHDDVEATWQPGEPYLTVTHTTVPLALLRAMLEAIDAQRPVAHAAASERVVERLRAMTPAEGLAALVDAGIVTPDGELTEAYREREPARPEPRYKVGDWVSLTRDRNHVWCVTRLDWLNDYWSCGNASGGGVSEKMLLPAIDPALHETARKTVAWLRSCRGGWADGYEARKALPGHREWDLEHKDNERWAAQLERLLGGAS